jgi:hypothetical protein
MGGLMAAAATRNDRHLPLRRSRHVCPDHNVLAVEQSEARGEVDHSLEKFANQMPWVVDELLDEDPLEMTGSRHYRKRLVERDCAFPGKPFA